MNDPGLHDPTPFDTDAQDLLEAIEKETGPDPEWSVLVLHGLGADGHDFVPVVSELVRPAWPAMRFVFPHAPVRPVTINSGMPMRAWYDIVALDLGQRADSTGVEASVVQVGALIERELARGIPPDHLFLAGFSQGGAITLATALRRTPPLAGIIALSTYLPAADRAAAVLAPGANAQRIFMGHGSADTVVPFQYGQQSADVLRGLGFNIDFHRYPMGHSVSPQEIRDLGDWIEQRMAAG